MPFLQCRRRTQHPWQFKKYGATGEAAVDEKVRGRKKNAKFSVHIATVSKIQLTSITYVCFPYNTSL